MARQTRTQAAAAASSSGSESGNEVDDQREVKLVDPQRTLLHLFLQSLISKRVVSTILAEKIYKQCAKLCGVRVDVNSFGLFQDDLSDCLQVLGLDFKKVFDQETAEQQMILVNTVSDVSAKLATDFKAEEIVFFRAIVGEIINADGLAYSVPMREALRCFKGSRTIAQELVKSFIAKGWLKLYKSSRLALSPRSLAELGGWLKETFNDQEDDVDDAENQPIVHCDLCREIVTLGYACPNANCHVRLHTFCVRNRVGANGLCPGSLSQHANACRQVWARDGNKFVGDAVGWALQTASEVVEIAEEEDELSPPPQTASAARKKKGRNAVTSDASEGDELMDE